MIGRTASGGGMGGLNHQHPGTSSGSATPSPRTPRPPSVPRGGSLKGLEGAKLTAAVRHAAAAAESRHRCFEQASVIVCLSFVLFFFFFHVSRHSAV